MTTMDGISFEKKNSSYVVRVKYLSDDLKNSIRHWLASICYGSINVGEDDDFYSYTSTLQAFFERYDNKTEKQKKGIIGELLSHVIIIYYFKYFKTISVLFNKEDKSMRKGFDIIVYNTSTNLLWYCEVKSGDSGADVHSKNTSLLNTAKNDIRIRLADTSRSTWDSALHDTNNTTPKNARKKIKELLKQDYSIIGSSQPLLKRVVLISVLYKGKLDVEIDGIEGFHESLVQEKIFHETMVMSIQKNTYQAVEDFLRSEVIGGVAIV